MPPMRTKLGRVAALTVMGVAAAVTCTSVVAASPTSTTVATTTTTIPVEVADMPTKTPGRGTQLQVTPTVPPPVTTTTLPPTALPPDSGQGRRVVYSKSRQRVWVVEEDGSVSRTYAVSGRRTWNQPTPNNFANNFEPEARYYSNPPAFYRVFSRSATTCNVKKPYLCWRYMVRFTKGDEGDNIGFHEIPVDTRTGRPVQDLSQLGTALSNGCVRQAPTDALYMWNWAWVGTKVVVLG
jgi:lipoprotein-anchoring transpeptidase ErfK/SrfK